MKLKLVLAYAASKLCGRLICFFVSCYVWDGVLVYDSEKLSHLVSKTVRQNCRS